MKFARKKAMRLLVPMVVVGTLYFVIQYLVPGTNNKGDITRMWRIYVFPYTIYWYLPSLFLIFMIQWCIDRYKKMESLRQWAVWCVAAILLSMVNDRGVMHVLPNLFSFKGALGQLPYFFAGVAACRFEWQIRGAGRLVRLALWGTAFLGAALIQVVWFASAEVAAVVHELYVLTVIAALFLLLEMRVHNRFFVWLGGYAYSIYLLHGFGTAGGRILLKMLGVKAVAAVFPVVTAAASVLPVVVDRVAGRYKAVRVLLLGKAA